MKKIKRSVDKITVLIMLVMEIINYKLSLLKKPVKQIKQPFNLLRDHKL